MRIFFECRIVRHTRTLLALGDGAGAVLRLGIGQDLGASFFPFSFKMGGRGGIRLDLHLPHDPVTALENPREQAFRIRIFYKGYPVFKKRKRHADHPSVVFIDRMIEKSVRYGTAKSRLGRDLGKAFCRKFFGGKAGENPKRGCHRILAIEFQTFVCDLIEKFRVDMTVEVEKHLYPPRLFFPCIAERAGAHKDGAFLLFGRVASENIEKSFFCCHAFCVRSFLLFCLRYFTAP